MKTPNVPLVRVYRRKRNFSKTLRTRYQFQSTPRNIRNLMADGRFPLLSFILGLISSLIACFQADYSRRRQNIIRLPSLPAFATVVKRRKVGSPFSLTWILPRFLICFCDFEERHNSINPHERNSRMAPNNSESVCVTACAVG